MSKKDFCEWLKNEQGEEFMRKAEIAKISLLQYINDTLNFFKLLIVLGILASIVVFFLLQCGV